MTFTEKKVEELEEIIREIMLETRRAYIIEKRDQDLAIKRAKNWLRKTIAEAEWEGIIYTLKLLLSEASKRANISEIEFLKQKLKELSAEQADKILE